MEGNRMVKIKKKKKNSESVRERKIGGEFLCAYTTRIQIPETFHPNNNNDWMPRNEWMNEWMRL